MNRLEQIRERVVPGAILSYGTVGDIANMYSTDIRYLLSKLETAEKALETVYDYLKQTDQELTKRTLLKALKQIRE